LLWAHHYANEMGVADEVLMGSRGVGHGLKIREVKQPYTSDDVGYVVGVRHLALVLSVKRGKGRFGAVNRKHCIFQLIHQRSCWGPPAGKL